MSIFGVFLVFIFSHSDQIRILHLFSLSVFSPNVEKYGPEKLRIRTLFTQCMLIYLILSISYNILFKIVSLRLEISFCYFFVPPQKIWSKTILQAFWRSASKHHLWHRGTVVRAMGSKPTIVETWPRPSQTSIMESFDTIVNGFQQSPNNAKISVLDFCGVPDNFSNHRVS